MRPRRRRGPGQTHTIRLEIVSPQGLADFEAGTLVIIPEPAAPALLALGWLAFARRRRRLAAPP